MEQYRKYKIAIAVLSFTVVLETFMLLWPLFVRPKKVALKPAAIKGKIAIVIDDWGYHLDNIRIAEAIPYPLTASVLPRLPYSQEVGAELNKRGIEVILHLPMEPHEKIRLERDTITTTMNDAQIRSVIEKDLADLPYAKGVSNHMGSLATEEPKTMETVLSELKQRHLFFLDSLVTPRSICFSLARKLRVSFLKRDVFLDNSEDQQYIRGQLERLKVKAARFGRAVGIGHDKKETLEVLKEEMPRLEKEGYRFVFASELAQ